MKNPTRRELQEYADGTLEKSRRHEIDSMLAHLPEARKQLEFFRALSSIVKEDQRKLPSKNFTGDVMGQILPPARSSLATKFFQNSSNVFAMAMVIFVIGFTVIFGTKQYGKDVDLPGGGQWENITAASSSMWNSVVEKIHQYVQPADQYSDVHMNKALVVGLLAFFGYLFVDEIIRKRILQTKARD